MKVLYKKGETCFPPHKRTIFVQYMVTTGATTRNSVFAKIPYTYFWFKNHGNIGQRMFVYFSKVPAQIVRGRISLSRDVWQSLSGVVCLGIPHTDFNYVLQIPEMDAIKLYWETDFIFTKICFVEFKENQSVILDNQSVILDF